MNTFSTSFRTALAATVLLFLAACATSGQTSVSRQLPERQYREAAIITGPQQAGDVSAALEAVLQRHGLATRINPRSTGSNVLIARYKDDWKRNGVTFLSRLTIDLLDSDGKTLLATSKWENPGNKQYQSVPEVVDSLVTGMMSRLPRSYTQSVTNVADASAVVPAQRRNNLR